MMELDIAFEEREWEIILNNVQAGKSFSALRFLALMEGEQEYAVEDALQLLEDKHITLDIADLPEIPVSDTLALRLKREVQLVRQGKLEQSLEENDPLRLYLEEIRDVEQIDDVQSLVRRGQDGDEAALAELAGGYLHKVVQIAKEYAGKGALLLDLIQEGNLGLWQAVLNLKDGDFDTHAQWWIRQYMAKLVTLQARAAGVGQKLRRSLEDYHSADRELLTKLGRNPTMEEIAAHLNITPEEGELVRSMLRTAQTMQKATQPSQPQPEEEEQAVEDTAYFQMRQRITELLSVLDETDTKILTLRFGLEGGLPMSAQDVGDQLKLTPEEVIAREENALKKLRKEG